MMTAIPMDHANITTMMLKISKMLFLIVTNTEKGAN